MDVKYLIESTLNEDELISSEYIKKRNIVKEQPLKVLIDIPDIENLKLRKSLIFQDFQINQNFADKELKEKTNYQFKKNEETIIEAENNKKLKEEFEVMKKYYNQFIIDLEKDNKRLKKLEMNWEELKKEKFSLESKIQQLLFEMKKLKQEKGDEKVIQILRKNIENLNKEKLELCDLINVQSYVNNNFIKKEEIIEKRNLNNFKQDIQQTNYIVHKNENLFAKNEKKMKYLDESSKRDLNVFKKNNENITIIKKYIPFEENNKLIENKVHKECENKIKSQKEKNKNIISLKELKNELFIENKYINSLEKNNSLESQKRIRFSNTNLSDSQDDCYCECHCTCVYSQNNNATIINTQDNYSTKIKINNLFSKKGIEEYEFVEMEKNQIINDAGITNIYKTKKICDKSTDKKRVKKVYDLDNHRKKYLEDSELIYDQPLRVTYSGLMHSNFKK